MGNNLSTTCLEGEMHIPPGPLYIARLLPVFLIPTAIAYGAFAVLERRSRFQIPCWLVLTLSILSQPILFVLKRYYARFQNRRQAAALGAEVTPYVEEKWPRCGFSTMALLINNFKNGFVDDIFLEWTKRYGYTYEMRFPTDSRIVTFEPDHVKAILATQFDAFDKGPIFYDQMNSLAGTGVFNSDGEMWKFHRRITRPFFSRERISDFDTFDGHANDALKQAKSRLAEGYPIDFQDLVSRFTLDSAAQFLFGNDVRSLSAGLPYPANSPLANSPAFLNHPSNLFVDAFLAGQIQAALRIRLGPHWPLGEFWGDKIKQHRDIVDQFFEPLVADVLARKQVKDREMKTSDVKAEDESVTLLEHLINHTQDTKMLKDELINLLVAARDTTASTLTYAFYMLAEHPKIADRLRAEIFAKVGATNRPSYDDMRDMKYLRAFINEVLRLYPAVPFDSRMSNRAVVWTSKAPGSKAFYIPANTKVLYCVFLMHRRTDLWGPDDRFLDERLHKYLTPNPYIFTPFNAGPRICLGQQFAYHEISFFLIRLLQQFTGFSLAPDAQPEGTRPPESWAGCAGSKGTTKVWPCLHMTMYVRGGLWVRMEELKASAETT